MAFTLPAMLNPLLSLLGMGLGIGALLGFIATRFRVETDPVTESINAILPQTQCGQCGYPGCRPYAEAIAAGDAINKCPPGGEQTIVKLADLLNVSALPLDEHFGKAEQRKVAFIREAECIGCGKCIPACPVDAILGAPKFMHTVITGECTGCDLCVEPCPVDCIDMIPAEDNLQFVATDPVSEKEFRACIFCALCVPVCPVDIQLHELYRACRNHALDQAQDLKLTHCIECGKCDTACPSAIPLVDYFQHAKRLMQRDVQDRERAERAKRRFELHQQRMTRLNAEEQARRQKRAELAANREQVSAEKIQAALERVKARNTET